MALVLGSCRPEEEGADPPSESAVPSQPVSTTEKTEPAIAELTVGAPVERRLEPGGRHEYRMELEQGDFIDLEVEQQGVDVVVGLYDPGGSRLLEMDLPIGDLGPEPLVMVAGRTGDYRLEIRAWESETSEGGYGASLRMRHPATGEDRLRAEAMKIFVEAQQLYRKQELESAIEHFKEALETWRKVDDGFWQAMTLYRLGSAYGKQGQWRRTVEVRLQASKIFARLDARRFEAISLGGVGNAWFELAEFEQASECHLRALELRQKIGDFRGLAIALQSLAEIYRIQGETQKALDQFSRALDTFDQPKDRRFRAVVLHNLGTLYHLAGKPGAAMDHLREAEQLFADLENPHQASALSRIGQLTFELGESDQALALLQRALDLHRSTGDLRGQAVALNRMGSIWRELGEMEKARRYYLEALELLGDLHSPRMRASALASLGSLYAELDLSEQSLASYLEALSLFEEAGDLAGESESLLGVAVAERRRGGLKAARHSAERALAIAENLRTKPFSEDLRSSFFSTAQRYFDFYIDLLMELHQEDPSAGHAAEALKMSERSRSRSLLDLLGEATAEIRGDAKQELLVEEQALQKRLNATVEPGAPETSAESVREIIRHLDEVRTEIRRQSPRYAALTQHDPLSLRRIQEEVLDRDTLLLEFKLGAERSFLWLVGDDAFASFELPSGEDIGLSVRRLSKLLGRGAIREGEVLTQELLCDLSRKLLAPVADRLEGQRLAIVAEGALQYLPFAALPEPGSSEKCSDALPLMASHEIVYLPSASTLAVLRAERMSRQEPTGLVAVVADPVFHPEDARIDSSRGEPAGGNEPEPSYWRRRPGETTEPGYRRLRHSREEAESILRLVPEDLGHRALDFDASKQVVVSGRLADYRVVHFGTHGVLDPHRPELSGIVLSQFDHQGQPVDGFLRAHEIYNLKLRADLVVLGACETALGKDVKGEGLVGMARGFMYAGASRILVSLWRVSDQRTSELMIAFYRALLQQHYAPAAALRSAQIAVRNKNPHPYHWAGFVLQGEWRSWRDKQVPK